MAAEDSAEAAAGLVEAFRALDGRRVGWLSTATVKSLLERYGDFSDAEKEEFLAEADQGAKVHYERLVNEIIFGDSR
ncbi:hypothetical protein DQ04_02311010 [Trypanosoma grayi]|uniref:hypothetical protein n=1 Tax=Trypanosoma grayi TaxID=71804 RepID=UPI0004F4394F|nr:hypothetical protein DQ04_02311010 [Trypanosoma grayi]KEG11749.1 hypothetical protein DQ04_02311010 [Trypanosoma grayi]